VIKLPNRPNTSNEQIEIFKTARAEIVDELVPEVANWSFAEMINQMWLRITRTKSQDRVRHFSRRVLKIPGNGNCVRRWMRGEGLMSKEEIIQVLRRLNLPQTNSGPPDPVLKMDSQTANKDLSRKLVDHTISVFNSLAGLLMQANISMETIYDGDRMHIRETLEKICKSLRVEVRFPYRERSVPLTQEELSDVGMGIPHTHPHGRSR
jgi:hypothetical protein